MTPEEILKSLIRDAKKSPKLALKDKPLLARLEYVSLCPSNRAGIRLLLACLLAKIHRPEVDARKPYTEIGTPDSFSGRTYDERHLTPFINKNQLPCNPTTAFLTPTLRNINEPLRSDRTYAGRPPLLYTEVIRLLDAVQSDAVSATTLFVDALRYLILDRDMRQERMSQLVTALGKDKDRPSLCSEDIVRIISQHLQCRHSSRLPTLIIAAAYRAVGAMIGESAATLYSHNAADSATGALGDVEIHLVQERDGAATVYEMKMKRVTLEDLHHALTKISRSPTPPENYIFITTEAVDPSVSDYAATLHQQTGGVEVVILDCLGFLRHFLHFFHRSRAAYLDAYQLLLLAEPESAVSQPLKEVFLTLRQAAEFG